jgi:hypothetical protein
MVRRFRCTRFCGPPCASYGAEGAEAACRNVPMDGNDILRRMMLHRVLDPEGIELLLDEASNRLSDEDFDEPELPLLAAPAQHIDDEIPY